MATDPQLLADPAELATKLGRSATDPKLLGALRSAARRFRGQVGHVVNLVTDEAVTLDGNGRQSLLLPVWPTTAVTEVRLDGTVLTEGTDYSWSEAGLLRRLGGLVWPDRLRCVEAVYSHGWPDSSIPEDIQEVVLERAEAAMLPVGVQSQAVGGQSLTLGAQIMAGATEAWTLAVARHKVRTSGDV